VAVNPALEAPAGTVTLAGTPAAELLLLSEATYPPVSAAPLSVTVHAVEPGPVTVAGEQERLEMVGPVGWTITTVPLAPDALSSSPGADPAPAAFT
jgi:hypothetical protein